MTKAFLAVVLLVASCAPALSQTAGTDSVHVNTSLDPSAAPQQQTGGRLKQRIVDKKRGRVQRLR
jgi:hypothetical protein